MKLYFRKIESCKVCPFYFTDHLNNFSKRCTSIGKDIESDSIPEWCPLIEYQEKIEVNETERVWIKISGK